MKYCLTLWLLVAASALAQDLSVTVYNQDLGLIREIRQVEVKKGAFTLEAADVAAQIDPTSVHLKLDGVALLDQDFEYDLVSRDRLLERYLDQDIEVFTEKGDLFSGKLLSASGTQLILKSKEGQVQVISPDAVRDVRFGELPGGLRTRPTLVWSMIGDKAGKQSAELSYMTHGLNWHAEYVVVTPEKSDKLDVSSWVSIENNSGATYENAKLKLMAGEVQVIQPPGPFDGGRNRVFAEAQMAKGAQGFEEKPFFEYHLYTLARPATLKDRQTKQIALFEPATVTSRREYVSTDGGDVKVNLVFKNEKKAGLGIPLPAGKVRVYQKDSDGSLEFVGEDQIDHTPEDEEVRLTVGSAFDIKAEREMTDQRQVSDRVRDESYKISLRNHKKENVEIKVVEHAWGTWEILQSSHTYAKKNATTIEFTIPVEAGKEVILTYSVRHR
ncbi:MAG: DUF4139 domain-containing protein [bacterium]|nr:DUF4139 domain-containing protein [bacterium]